MTPIAHSHTSHAAHVNHLLAQASDASAQHVFTQIYRERALAQAKELDDSTQRGDALGALQGMTLKTHTEFIETLQEYGFAKNPLYKECKTDEELWETISSLEEKMKILLC